MQATDPVTDGGPYRPVPKAPVCLYPHYDVRAATWGRGFPRGLWMWKCVGCGHEQSWLVWNARFLKQQYVRDDPEYPGKYRPGRIGVREIP